MIRSLFLITFLGFMQTSCNNHQKETQIITGHPHVVTTKLYSAAVADSFYISVSLPDEYYTSPKHSYPVAYLLDANLYFDIMATTIRSYSGVGLAPDVILVGIGYKDFPAMDSLRNRDYTYPVAIPEYEMSTSGGADKFLSFINKDLVPFINHNYHPDTTKRVLMGHSLGGYFTMYAMLQQLKGAGNSFTHYIAASPSFHYNNYYLLNELAKLNYANPSPQKVSSYITFGGLEEPANTDSTSMKLPDLIKQLSTSLSSGQVNFKADIYSNLDHMDTQLPTFIKGLQRLDEK